MSVLTYSENLLKYHDPYTLKLNFVRDIYSMLLNSINHQSYLTQAICLCE